MGLQHRHIRQQPVALKASYALCCALLHTLLQTCCSARWFTGWYRIPYSMPYRIHVCSTPTYKRRSEGLLPATV